MKAVIVGTDFVKDTDGSYKVLETNTSIAFNWKDASNYVDVQTALNQILSGSSVTSAYLVATNLGNKMATHDLQSDVEGTHLEDLFDTYFSSSNISSSFHAGSNGIVPYIEDTDDKLILRQAYDQTATFDTTYAKDNYSFLKLVYDNDSTNIPKTFIPNTGSAASFSFDMIGTSIRDNAGYPNFLVKKRYPTTDYSEYPKIYKIDTQEDLTNLKNSISDQEFLQEYIIDSGSLTDGKLTNYRSIDIIYGSNLDSVNLASGYAETNLSPFSGSVDYDDNNEIQQWERARFLHKIADYQGRAPIVLGNNRLLSGSNNISGSELEVGSVVKTLSIPDLSDDLGAFVGWTGSLDTLVKSGSLVDTTVQAVYDTDHIIAAVTIHTSSSLSTTVPGAAKLLIASGSTTKFIEISSNEDLLLSSSVVIYDNNQTTVRVEPVTHLEWSWYHVGGGTTLEVEQADTYLVEDNNDSNLFLTFHNVCSGTQFYYPPGGYCQACGPNYQYFGKGTMCCSSYSGPAYQFPSPSCSFSK